MISAVVPCFNEASVLEGTTRDLTRVLDRLAPGAWEIILVDDGSTDATWDVVQGLARVGTIRTTRHARNRGKGAAVRTGVALSRGDAVLVCDADGSTPPDTLEEFVRALADGAAIVIGDRWSPGAVLDRPQPRLRRLLGGGYVLLSRALSGLRLRDFNCGFKLFRGDLARSLLGSSRSDRWTWDVEVLALAARRGLVPRPLPVRWSQGPRSAVHPLRDVARSLRDLAALWWQLKGRGAPLPKKSTPA